MVLSKRPLAVLVPILWSASLTGCTGLINKPAPEQDLLWVEVLDEFKLDDPTDAWTFRTPELWSIGSEQTRRFLQMNNPPERPILPGVLRPQEYAIYSRYAFRSFSFSCAVRIDCDTSIKGRDACIIFGRRDDTHFYYAHLSNFTDETHNSLVRVDGDKRHRILPATCSPEPAISDRTWHKIDILRDVDAGTIEVYVDEARPPLFHAVDRTYETGYIGMGSFNDYASFGRVIIQGYALSTKEMFTQADQPPSPRE